MSIIRRVRAEINYCHQNNLELDATFWTNSPDDVFSCTGVIMGPKDSVYDGGMFFVDIQYPEDYPYKPPNITFMTKIYNPCINSKGKISLDILDSQWSISLIVPKVLISIQNVMQEFDVEYAIVPEIAYQYKLDRSKYDCIAREWTALFAM